MLYGYIKGTIMSFLKKEKPMKIRFFTLLTTIILILSSPMINAFKVQVGSEKEEFDVPESAIQYMITIENMRQDLPSTLTDPIPLPNIETKIFNIIMEIIEKLEKIQDSNTNKLCAKKISETEKYLRDSDNSKSHKIIVSLAAAANYLDFNILFEASILDLQRRFNIDKINSQLQVYMIETLIKGLPGDITNQLLAATLERVIEEIIICGLSNLKNLKPMTGKIQGEDEIRSVSWNPKNETLASGSRNGIVAIRNIKDGKITKEIQEKSEINSVSWDPTGKRVVYSYYDTTTQRCKIKIWDVKKDETEVIKTLEEGNKVTAVSYSPDGKHIAFGFYSKPDNILVGNMAAQPGTIEILNIKTKTITKTLQGHKKLIRAIAWHPNSQHLASGSFDGYIRLWDVKTGKTTNKFLVGRLGVVSLAWSSSGKHIFSSSLPQGITIWDVENNKKIISDPDLGKWVISSNWHLDGAISLFSAFGYRSGENKSGEIQRWQPFDNTTQKKLISMIIKNDNVTPKINISTAQALEIIAVWNAQKKGKQIEFEHITDPVIINLLKQQCK